VGRGGIKCICRRCEVLCSSLLDYTTSYGTFESGREGTNGTQGTSHPYATRVDHKGSHHRTGTSRSPPHTPTPTHTHPHPHTRTHTYHGPGAVTVYRTISVRCVTPARAYGVFGQLQTPKCARYPLRITRPTSTTNHLFPTPDVARPPIGPSPPLAHPGQSAPAFHRKGW
jgi:hypothetical protein